MSSSAYEQNVWGKKLREGWLSDGVTGKLPEIPEGHPVYQYQKYQLVENIVSTRNFTRNQL